MFLSSGDAFRSRYEAKSSSDMEMVPGRPNVLVATVDPQIRKSMGELLEGYAVNALWASGMEEVTSVLAREDVLACFCGFWLVDGTYRDVVRRLKHQRAEVPMIIVCAPSCPQEYRDYLAALNIRALDFICHPYRRIDMERILESASALRKERCRASASVTKVPDRRFEATELPRAS
jgi:DNA-binding NtrC family response regulator